MASINDIIQVSTTLDVKSATGQAFGVPIILGATPAFGERVRTYTSPAGMISDGFSASDPVYLAAAAMFSQSPTVPLLKIGRLVTNLTAPVITLTPVVVNKGVYTLTVNGVTSISTPAQTYTPPASSPAGTVFELNINGTVYRYTTAGTETATDVANGLRTAFAAQSPGPYTGVTTGGTATLTLTFAPGVTPAVTTSSNLTLSANTAAEIVTAALAARSASSNAALFTTTGSTSTLVLTGATAGISPMVGSTGFTRVSTTGTQAAADFVTDMTAIRAADDQWYGAHLVSQAKADILGAAEYFESSKRILFVQSADTDVAGTDLPPSDAAGNDVLSRLRALSRSRTALFYSTNGSHLADGALGTLLALPAASATLAFKTIAGATPETFSSTQEARLRAKNANWLMSVSGLTFLSNTGTMASGLYADLRVLVDYIESGIQIELINALANAPKIPYDDTGFAAVRGRVEAFLLGEEVRGTVVRGTTRVTVPKRADTTTQDRADRVLRSVTYSCVASGAIHKILVTGTVSQ